MYIYSALVSMNSFIITQIEKYISFFFEKMKGYLLCISLA